jgi:hypothetical protein
MSKKEKNKDYLKLRDGRTNIDLGKLLAEQDYNLTNYYEGEIHYLSKASDFNNPTSFFIGPKGVGKSAILQMIRLRNLSDSQRVIDISKDDIGITSLLNSNLFDDDLEQLISNQFIFKILWDYVITLEFAKREYKPKTGFAGMLMDIFVSDQHIHKTIKRLFALSDPDATESFTGRMLELLKTLKVSGEYAGAKLSFEIETNGKKKENGKNDSPAEVLNTIHNAAKAIRGILHNSYYILIDDLDHDWQYKNIQNAFVSSLFTCLKSYHHSDRIKFVIALRDDIFDVLHIKDRDKIYDWVCLMTWDHDTLKKIIESRIVNSFHVSRNDIWNGMFQDDSFDKVLHYTRRRPRELIRMFYLILDVAINSDHKHVTEADMQDGIKQASEEKLSEFEKEYLYLYPNLKYILIRLSSSVNKEFPYQSFTDFIDVLCLEKDLGDNPTINYNWILQFKDNPKLFLLFLLEKGFLLIKMSRTDKESEYNPAKCPEITSNNWFVVHSIYQPGLGVLNA